MEGRKRKRIYSPFEQRKKSKLTKNCDQFMMGAVSSQTPFISPGKAIVESNLPEKPKSENQSYQVNQQNSKPVVDSTKLNTSLLPENLDLTKIDRSQIVYGKFVSKKRPRATVDISPFPTPTRVKSPSPRQLMMNLVSPYVPYSYQMQPGQPVQPQIQQPQQSMFAPYQTQRQIFGSSPSQQYRGPFQSPTKSGYQGEPRYGVNNNPMSLNMNMLMQQANMMSAQGVIKTKTSPFNKFRGTQPQQNNVMQQRSMMQPQDQRSFNENLVIHGNGFYGFRPQQTQQPQGNVSGLFKAPQNKIVRNVKMANRTSSMFKVSPKRLSFSKVPITKK